MAKDVKPEDNEQAQSFETIGDTIISRYVCHVLNCPEKTITAITPLAKGGSDRTFRRIQLIDAPSLIFMHYNHHREENRYYAAIAAFLEHIGVAVPRIFDHDVQNCLILMEDLGDVDLWSYRNLSWDKRRIYYRSALDLIYGLHTFPLANPALRSLKLMPGFGPALYLWERGYFFDNFVSGVCGIKLAAGKARAVEKELAALALSMELNGAGLVHRDFQSQNILICRDNPVIIDFQGMRTGSPFYDLGSLLYDPYVAMSDAERTELLWYYYETGKGRFDWDTFQERFHEASVQRLMQALGAYGYLGLRHGRKDFLAHIPAGLKQLTIAASCCKNLPAFGDLLVRCRDSLCSHADFADSFS